MSLSIITAALTSQLAAMAAVLVLAGILPFVASLFLDGVVQVLRSNGLKVFGIALALTLLVAGAGFFVLQYGLSVPGIPANSTSAMNSLAQTILTFTFPLALVAFVVRTIKNLATA
ncbi:hypothetical protein E3T35_09980 [Cryobacterium sp. TMT1-2-2]|uniref:hypothetical protein n=1 Tax=Cryobacterium sp. TMT1-2-2 TaxID=1259233 RepID=UPI00106C3C66|nr:hypothetical protein [Cryobacterium sp. TMT1-2-2]TFD10921.1 hypothetical protein E3T35_09980 [Cryobacterium sp. TMT1-2-2]